jgi:hypothetical protein
MTSAGSTVSLRRRIPPGSARSRRPTGCATSIRPSSRNGRDWRDYDGALSVKPEPAKAIIKLERTGPDALEALVTPLVSGEKWSAYWTVTENGHSSKVKSGENAGEFLQHDFVVRQYVPVGAYEGEQRLRVRVVAAERGHGRTVNLVVGSKGRVWQASAMHMDTGATGKCSS